MIISDGSNPTGRRRRRLSFDREQALETALRLFWQRGYEGTSVADLVAAMGITPPSLYTAFGSKEELYREAVERYGTTHAAFMLAALDSETTARGAIERLLNDALHFYADPANPGGCMIATTGQYSGLGQESVAGLLTEKRSAVIRAIEARIARGVAEGENIKHDPRTLAHFVAAAMQGLAVQAKDGLDAGTMRGIVSLITSNWLDLPHG